MNLKFKTPPSQAQHPINLPPPEPLESLEQPQTPPTPSPQNPNLAHKSDDGFISGSDFFGSAIGDVNLSADSLVNEQTGEVTIKPEPVAATAPAQQLPPTEADLYKAENFIEFRDMLQSRGLAWAAGDFSAFEKFKFTQEEKKQLIKAYAPLLRSVGGIPPWLSVAGLEVMIMGPKIMDVIDFRKEKARADHYERLYHAERTQREQLQTNFQAQQAGERLRRIDRYKLWQVDREGYFTGDDRGKYLIKEKRRKKPIPSLDWDLLSKHNKPEILQQAFPNEYKHFSGTL